MAGKVILVGAGPGGAGLLTLRGLEALKSAEVVVYDRLVDEEILRLIPETAERINVGKNVGDHPVPQHRINEILLEKAQEGLRVVRLKGGDCFVFGRGGEELEPLAAHGVDFEVVPGITSALAVPAFAGIPVTHRDYCASVHIITGHRKKNESLTLDFDALVRLDGTLVFLMSLATFPEIARGLAEAGMPEETPCAIIENGARPEQRRWVTTVGGAEACIAENGVRSPAIFVVGRVCALSEQLDWFDRLPLKGKRILTVPPRAGADGLIGMLRAKGARVIVLPAPDKALLPVELPARGESVLLTAPEAVEAMLEALEAKEMDARELCGVRLVCGGKKTAEALRRRGLRPDEILGGRTAEEMLSACEHAAVRVYCGEEDATELEDRYPEATICAAWRLVVSENTEAFGDVDCVALTSLNSVLALTALAKKDALTGQKAVCIGERVAQAARALGMDAVCAAEMSLESVIEGVVKCCSEAKG